MSTLCIVCYHNEVKEPICWGSYICSECLKNWAKSRIVQDRIRGEVTIPCPNYNCNQALISVDLFNTIGPDEFEKVNVLFTDLYLSNTEDIRKCPSQKCEYAGVISLDKCGHSLKCPEWKYSWQEYTHMSDFQKLIKSLKDLISLNSESYSYINKVLTGSPCPKWGLVILKDGGCNHMVWQKWNYEFWWLWLGHYPGYKHTQDTHWFLRKFIMFFLMWIFVINLDYNLCKQIPILGNFQYCIYEWAWYIIAPNIFALLILFEFIILAVLGDWCRGYATQLQKTMKIPTLIAALSYPIMYFSTCYYIYVSPKWSFIVTVLLYELMVLSFSALVIVAIYFSVLAMVYFFFIPLLKVLRYLFNTVWSLYFSVKDLLKAFRFLLTGFKIKEEQISEKERLKFD